MSINIFLTRIYPSLFDIPDDLGCKRQMKIGLSSKESRTAFFFTWSEIFAVLLYLIIYINFNKANNLVVLGEGGKRLNK